MKTSLLLVVLGAVVTGAVDTISAVGNKLFYDNSGTQFFIKGVAYQLVPDDPLIDTAQCQRDAQLMKALGTNTIRVYHVDAKGDHDGCMKVFAEAGIYTLIDLDTFETYIVPHPSQPPRWTQSMFDSYAAVMDEFIVYSNVLGFFIGNEDISMMNQSVAAPYLKAAARDMKAYRDRKKYRTVPIGYSATDIAELRPMLQDYLTCGGNNSEIVDFFALNSYQWCGQTTYTESGYANLQKLALDFPVPIFFSESGCNKPRPRTFEDQTAIFGPEMNHTWSGCVLYEWIEEANNYGLVKYGEPVSPTATVPNAQDGFIRAGTPIPMQPDFDNLKGQWATLHPAGINRANYIPAVSTRDCPKATPGGWEVDGNVALPALGQVYSGSFTSSPSATDVPTTSTTDTGSAASSTPSDNPAPPMKEVAGMSAGLIGVMLYFTVWL